MINLSNTTIIAIDGSGDDFNAIKAIKKSCEKINFKKVKLLTASNNKNEFCETYKIDKMDINQYSWFCLNKLWEYIDTENFLLVQSDGFVLNPELWDNSFLNYDYVGAAWSKENVIATCNQNEVLSKKMLNNKNFYQVGNGGFSLRSRKLALLTSKLYRSEYGNIPEDIVIGIAMREELEEHSIKFADVDTAMKFSVENRFVNGNRLTTFDSFGFHSKYEHPHLLRLLDDVKL